METIEAISLRQSTRSYKTEQISEEELTTILNSAYAAPVGMGAYDSLNITVVQNQNLLSKITENFRKATNTPKGNPLYNAPTVIFISSKTNEKFPHVGLANASCIIENMSLAATDLGLSSVYLLGFIPSFIENKELVEELNLPDGFVPVSALALGYPDKKLEERTNKHHIKTNIIK